MITSGRALAKPGRLKTVNTLEYKKKNLFQIKNLMQCKPP